MAVTAKWYGQGMLGQFSSSEERRVDWVNDPIKVALVKAAYTPNQDTDDFWSDVSANETTGAGYTAGGKELAERASTYNAGTNTTRLDAADTEWKELTAKFRYAVIYKDTGEASASPLLGIVDFGKEEEVTAGTAKIEWAVDGVLRVVVSE